MKAWIIPVFGLIAGIAGMALIVANAGLWAAIGVFLMIWGNNIGMSKK